MNDLTLYETHGTDWWKPDSPFALLGALNAPRFAFFSRFVPSFAGLEVCDLGCGGGFTSEHLARLGAHVTGVDIAEKALEAARNHAREQGLAIDYVRAAGERLPLPDASCDAVVCFDVLEHVESVPAVLAQAKRVLRPGGWLLFDTISRTPVSRLVTVKWMEDVVRTVPRGTHDWRMFIRPRELEAMLAVAGFEKPTFVGFRPQPFWSVLTPGATRFVPGGPLWALYGGACQARS